MRTDTQWFNQRQPQTLQIAVLLLYIHAAFGLLELLMSPGELLDPSQFASVPGVVFLLGIVGGVAAFGIANERRWGYGLGLAAAIAPIGARLYSGSPLSDLLGLMLEVALVIVLVHPMSRGYYKIWFK